MVEMQMKKNAPPLRPDSPDRKLKTSLEDIPEASPGPNAFAQQAARMERYRLEGNAFYQQEVQKRAATPPTNLHPALRMRSNSDPLTPPRLSSRTTMSPFIHAGSGTQDSPPLRLVPEDASFAEPTTRGYIEERREKLQHERNGSKDERTPVFIPTPKVACTDWATSSDTPKKEVTIAEPPPTKTPKKGLFERLKISTNFRGISSPSTSTLGTMPESQVEDSVPVKAQAVLGSSPTKGRTSFGSTTTKPSIPRSPSKRKGLFSRKNSNLTDMSASNAAWTATSASSEQAPMTESAVTKTPPTAFSDPTHYSYQSTRIASHSHSDKGQAKDPEINQCAIARSQSLKYFDHTIPPTPPAKNTPPEEKARKEAALASKSSRMPFHGDQTSPSKEPEGLVSVSGRTSPTRFGSYGHRETPTLITKPSVYSLHASVVPSMTEANTFEEMKARIDGLGLEGFSMPPENVRNSTAEKVYSPSIYSTEWNARPGSVIITPALRQMAQQSNSPSGQTKQSSSSGRTVPICYPELAKDPSLSNMTGLLDASPKSNNSYARSCEHLEATLPWHGRTHSRDHSASPHHSRDSSIFAEHVDDDLDETYYGSPTSFSHASATPSPLQMLRPTVYTPARQSSKLKLHENSSSNTGDVGPAQSHHYSGLGIQRGRLSASGSPSRRNEVFENAPSLQAYGGQERSRSPSPHDGAKSDESPTNVDVDPKKQSPAKSPSSDKLDRMIDMLNQIKARNRDFTAMRDEMRASNARLDRRIAAMESSQRASPTPSSDASYEHINSEAHVGRPTENRVPTNVARNFYREGQGSERNENDGATHAESENESFDTIAELKETNQRLLEMVGGFAEKIKALEAKARR